MTAEPVGVPGSAAVRGSLPDNDGPAWRRIAIESVCATTVVYLLFGPYLSTILTGRNATWQLWQPGDPYILLGVLAALALLGVGLRELIRSAGPASLLRAFDHLFVIGLGAGLLANLWFHTSRPHGYRIGQFGMEMQSAWLVMLAVVGYSLATPTSRLVLRCRQLCQVVSPAVLIITVQLLRLPTLPPAMDPLASTPAQPVVLPVRHDAGNPVYVFIFDEWSYPRTYEAGWLRSTFSNLTALSNQAITFHAARAPGRDTARSIPGICRGTDSPPDLRGLSPGFLDHGTFVSAERYPSIFTAAGCPDHRKVMVHFGYALNLWLQDELDVSRAYSWYPRGEHALNHAGLQLYNAAFYWTDPWSIFIFEKLQTRTKDAQALRMHEGIHRDALAVLRNEPARTFAILHYPLPHHPYVLDPDGTYRGPDPGAWDKAGVEGYQRNLAYLDHVVGEIVGTLKAVGRFDDALLILTSDHSWRNDPATPNPTFEELTHVPLIVKLPGQTEPLQMDGDFRTHKLGEFIGRALRSNRPAPMFVQRDAVKPIAHVP